MAKKQKTKPQVTESENNTTKSTEKDTTLESSKETPATKDAGVALDSAKESPHEATKDTKQGEDVTSAQAKTETKTESKDTKASKAKDPDTSKDAETSKATSEATTSQATSEATQEKNATPAPIVRRSSHPSKSKENNGVANIEDTPVTDKFKSHIIVVTSGKGGVGKTTTAAAISTGLALKGHKTVVIDFDVGLRNLDLVMGCERRVVYDFIDVLNGEARLNQALIKDRHSENLFILPASQTKDKDSLSYSGVGHVLKELSDQDFEYIICDSPAGIEAGALIALYYSDEAIVTTNPEVSSVRDSDRIIGILNSKSRRACNDWEPVVTRLLLTRYIPNRVTDQEMISVSDVQSLLNIPLLGVIPESPDVLVASNGGESIILNQQSNAGLAYSDTVERILGNNVPLRFIDATPEKKGFLQRLFGK